MLQAKSGFHTIGVQVKGGRKFELFLFLFSALSLCSLSHSEMMEMANLLYPATEVGPY